MLAGEEEKRRAHEALEKQEAELARYAQQVAADQQQAAALQAKIKAMEEKVTFSSPASYMQPFAIVQQTCQFLGACHVQSNECQHCNLSVAMQPHAWHAGASIEIRH